MDLLRWLCSLFLGKRTRRSYEAEADSPRSEESVHLWLEKPPKRRRRSNETEADSSEELVHLRFGGERPKRRRRSNEIEEADHWSSVPYDILESISLKIGSIEEYLSFSRVCRSWNSFATDFTSNPRFGPYYVSEIIDESNTVTIQDPSSDQTLTLTLNLPRTPGRFFWGSPFGWLIAFHPPGLSLLNPFTGSSIALPDLPAPWANDSQGISGYLSACPVSDPDNYLVIILSGYVNKLAFVKPGGNWNYLPLHPGSNYKAIHRDSFDFYGVTYFKGNLYGLHSLHSSPIQVVSFLSNRVTHVTYLDLLPCRSYEKYLVDLHGQLCLCIRYYQGKRATTVDFKFFVIDVLTGGLTQLGSLGDRCVFLDRNYSFSYKVRYPPGKLFERSEHALLDESVSNYVFYNRNAIGLQVWDMLRSCEVRMRNAPSSPTSLWILPRL